MLEWSALYAAVECMSSAESVWHMLECQFCCELLLLWTWHIWLFCTVEWPVLSVLLVCSYAFWGEFCGLHSWQNSTRCRDGVKVLWYHSHLAWLVFEGSISTRAYFRTEKFLLICFCCFFIVRKREEKWEGRPRERCMLCKVWKYRTLLLTINKQAL